MRIRVVLILSINLFITQLSYSQHNDRILLVVFEGEELLSPLILNYLSEMKYVEDDSSYNAFNYIINSNRLEEHIKEQLENRELILILEKLANSRNTKKNISAEDKKIYENLIKRFNTISSILYVRTNLIGNIIEFQFELYSDIKVTGSSVVNFDPLKPEISHSILLYPNKMNYNTELIAALIQVFPKSNLQPVSVIKINGNSYNSGDVLYFTTQDTITIDATESYDRDESKTLKYFWRDISKFGDYLKYNSPIQKLSFTSTGNYKIGFIVNDGINSSFEDTINIRIVEKPKIFVRNPIVYNPYQISIINLFQKRKHRLNFQLYVSSINAPVNSTELRIIDIDEQNLINSINTLSIYERILAGTIDEIYDDSLVYYREIFIDSIQTDTLGSVVHFTGRPNSGIYNYVISAINHGIESNEVRLKLEQANYFPIKQKFWFSRHHVFKRVESGTMNSTPGSPLANTLTDSTIALYNYTSFPYTIYFTKRFSIDIDPFAYAYRESYPINRLIPTLGLSYDLETAKYSSMSQTLLFSLFKNDNETFNMVYNFYWTFSLHYKGLVYLSYSLDPFGSSYIFNTDYKYRNPYNFSITLDLIKLLFPQI